MEDGSGSTAIKSASSPDFSSPSSICAAIDKDADLRKSAISYISNDQVVPIRGSDLVLQNHVIITPAGEEKISGTRLKDGLIEAGVDCALAGFGYSAAAMTCSSTAITMGAAAPLCIVSVTGLSASTWKCANSVGKLVNDAYDPNLNKELEESDSWLNDFNTVVNWIDNAATLLSLGLGFKSMQKLGRLSSKHAGKVGYSYSRKESIQAYKDLAEATGETLSNQGVKRWINSQGHSVRFSNKSINKEISKAIANAGIDTADFHDDPVKSGIRNLTDGPAIDSRPRHVMHVLQQAKP